MTLSSRHSNSLISIPPRFYVEPCDDIESPAHIQRGNNHSSAAASPFLLQIILLKPETLKECLDLLPHLLAAVQPSDHAKESRYVTTTSAAVSGLSSGRSSPAAFAQRRMAGTAARPGAQRFAGNAERLIVHRD